MIDPMTAALLRLQDSDMRRRDLGIRLTTLPKEMDKLLARRETLAKETAAAEEAVRKEELAIKGDESRISALTDESRKLQQQSAMVKKNAEYQAMLAGIEQNKAKISAIEEQLLGRFDQVEELRTKAAAVKKKNASEMRELRTEFEELLAFSKTVKEEIAKLDSGRAALTRNILPDKLARYENILRGKDAGEPLVKVENGCCGHCHMRVTLQTMNALSKGEMQYCDNCQHLLYPTE